MYKVRGENCIMKYSIAGFRQDKLVEYGLDIVDAYIIRWFLDFKATEKMASIEVEGKIFFWVKYQAVLDALPVSGVKNKKSLYRRFELYCALGLFQKHLIKNQKGTFTYFNNTSKIADMIYDSEAEDKPELTCTGLSIPTPEDSNVLCAGDSNVHPNDSSITDNSSITDKEYAEASVESSAGTPGLAEIRKQAKKSIREIFVSGSSVLNSDGKPYRHDGKQAKHIDSLVNIYLLDPVDFENTARKFWKMIREDGGSFWGSQPFSPSAFNSLYDRIKAFKFKYDKGYNDPEIIKQLMAV